MKTHELLTAPEADLVPQLRQMKTKELERHATKLLGKMGAEYSAVLAAVTRAVPELDKATGDTFTRFQQAIRPQLTRFDSAEHGEMLKRVAVIMMLIIQRQFQKIHTGG